MSNKPSVTQVTSPFKSFTKVSARDSLSAEAGKLTAYSNFFYLSLAYAPNLIFDKQMSRLLFLQIIKLIILHN